jgi:transcriptional regulator with XRE-family HTH domain
MPDESHHIVARVAARVRALRTARGLALDKLAEASGVSRSMISAIERAEASPTAALLDRLAAGLGVPLAALFEGEATGAGPLARHADQPVWRDPATGYVRRAVSPPSAGSPFRIVEVTLPAGARVAYDVLVRAPEPHQVWLMEGALRVSVGEETHELGVGDCLAFTLDRPNGFHNPGPNVARYAVIVRAGTNA